MIEVIELWWHGQLITLFGIPILWIARIGKLFQFLSGLVIVLDIVGKERFEVFGNNITDTLNSLAKAEPLKKFVKNSWRSTLLFFRWLNSEGEFSHDDAFFHELLSYKQGLVIISAFIVLPFCALYYPIHQYGWSWNLVWQFPLTWFIAAWVILLSYFTALNAIAIVFFIIFSPLEKITDLFFQSLSKFIANRGLVRPIIFLSFFLFILGMMMDFMSS